MQCTSQEIKCPFAEIFHNRSNVPLVKVLVLLSMMHVKFSLALLKHHSEVGKQLQVKLGGWFAEMNEVILQLLHT